MKSYKVTENLGINSFVTSFSLVSNGNIPAPTWELVSGKGSIDNDKFDLDINGDTVDIRNNVVLSTGTYYFRLKISQGNQSFTDFYRIYTDDKAPVISVDSTTYMDDIVVDDEVATVSLTSGNLTDITIHPESSLDSPDLPAMSYDGSTGKIEWTGSQSPTQDYQYNIVYNDGSCFTSQLTQLFESIEVIAISPSLCAYPGSGSLSATTVQRHRGQINTKNSFTSARANIQNSANNQIGNLGAAIEHLTGAGQRSVIDRSIDSFDTTSLPGTKNQLRLHWNANNTARTWYIYWKDATLPAVNNPTYDMVDSWNLLGSVTCPSTGTFGSIDLDVSSLPDTTTLQIGVATESDVLSDFAEFTDVAVSTNSYRCSSLEMFGCP